MSGQQELLINNKKRARCKISNWAIPEKIQTGDRVEDMEFPGVSKK